MSRARFIFVGLDFGYEANSKFPKGPKVVRGPHGDGPELRKLFEKPIGSGVKNGGKAKK